MDAAAALSARFVAVLGGARHDEPGGLLGIEQEFTVRTGSEWPADFRELLPELPIAGDPLDPGDPSARRVASGVVITADGREAEAVTPPVEVRPGFARDAAGWARVARHELESRLPDAYTLSGYSTHLSVSIDDARNPRVAALYTRTFAPGLMLLVDRATSPGLIVRPRPGRVELCGEFVDGPWLRAAAVFSVGSVLACRDAVRGARSLDSLPPPLQVAVRPASARAGWYVDRGAFGTDLLAHGRQARLRRCDSRRMRAQDHLEWAWSVARDALVSRVAAEDVAAVDDIVSGELPLPSHAAPAVIDAGEPVALPDASPLGAVDNVRIRAGFTVHALASTWKHTVFCVRSRVRNREAYASVPRAHLARFFEQLEGGALDRVIGEYLALDAAERPLAMTGSEPSLGDVAPSADAVTERELDRQLSDTVPSQWARERKDVVEIPGIGETVTQRRGCLPFVPRVTERPGCLPGTKWLLVGGVVVALVIGGIVIALIGGGGGGEQQSSTSITTGSECGKDATGATIDWRVIRQKCEYKVTGGVTYKFDSKPFETATIDVGTTAFKPYIGEYCKIHDATATELDNARDPLTNFRGLSLFGVPIAGLQPNGLVQIGVVAPDGAVRTGNGVADAKGYAEVRIPIKIPQNHTILSANYYASGSTSGPVISIPPTDIAPNGVLDGSFPGTRCNRDATLALVPKQTNPNDASKQAKAAFTSSASLFPLLVSLANPGADVSLSGPWTVGQEGSYYAAQGSGVSFDLVPGTNTGGDKPGDAPAFVAYYAGTVVYPTSAGTGDAWGRGLPVRSRTTRAHGLRQAGREVPRHDVGQGRGSLRSAGATATED